MPVVERTLTDMLRSSGEVLREAEHQDVVLRRRDGADVMLVDLEREQSLRQSLLDAARIIMGLEEAPAPLIERLVAALPSVIPWTGFLPDDERLAFLREFAATATACVETQVFEPLAQLDREWRATAAAHADPELLAVLKRQPADREWRESEVARVPRP